MERAAADFVIIKAPPASQEGLWHTPNGVSHEVASTLPIAGLTASAALDAIDLQPDETVLVGGAAGGVGVFAVQLAKLAGATVIGSCSQGTFEFLRDLGVEPVAYGDGLADRVRAIAPGGITSAVSLVGRETIDVALELGVPPERISTIATGSSPPVGVRETGGIDSEPEAVVRIAELIEAGRITVPIAKTFTIDKIRDAVALQAGFHVHGKIVVTL